MLISSSAMSKALERSENWKGASDHFNVSVFQHAWESVHDILVVWVVNSVRVFSMSQLHRSMAAPGSGALSGERSGCVAGRGRDGGKMFFPVRI